MNFISFFSVCILIVLYSSTCIITSNSKATVDDLTNQIEFRRNQANELKHYFEKALEAQGALKKSTLESDKAALDRVESVIAEPKETTRSFNLELEKEQNK